jgi:hypothetical protein
MSLAVFYFTFYYYIGFRTEREWNGWEQSGTDLRTESVI